MRLITMHSVGVRSLAADTPCKMMARETNTIQRKTRSWEDIAVDDIVVLNRMLCCEADEGELIYRLG